MSDPCPTCLRPIATKATEFASGVCTKRLGKELWRSTQCFNNGIQARDARLAAALKVARCGLDVRARLREVDGSGSATVCFSAALSDLNQLLPEAERVLVGQDQLEREAARRG